MSSRVVFLVGVNHTVQHRHAMTPQKEEYVSEFQDYLRSQIATEGIEILAEEFSEEALVGSTSPTREVAEQTEITHAYCDPSTQERASHNIAGDDERERFWLKRLDDLMEPGSDSAALFLCGSDHLASFEEQLRHAGYKVRNLGGNWGDGIMLPSPFDPDY